MTDTDTPWLVGCGSADVTGEPWDAGMLGYGMRWQRSEGLRLRQRSRAFVVAEPDSGRRLVLVVADLGMVFRNVREAVLARLAPHGLAPSDVLLTATHTHAGAGGLSCYRMYGTTNSGIRPHTLAAAVEGIVASVEQALADLAPGRLRLTRGTLSDASVNRSPTAFARNPATDRAHFPDAVDPSTVVLRLEREGRVVGLVDWFATHGTSLSNRNLLLSGDNKGYAAAALEALLGAGAVAAFGQTNAGDMSPNVPDATRGPTPDDVENTRLIGERQVAAVLPQLEQPGEELLGGLDTRLSHVRLPGLPVSGEHTPDGRPHRLGAAVLGAAFAAGTKEGPGVGLFEEGVEGNRFLSACSALAYRLRPGVGDAQRPKAMLLPVGALGWTAETVPVQLVRLGRLVLVALAQEVTVVAGLRLRRAVAGVLDVSLEDVLVLGYANDYAGYVTTPEEYDAQRYEGGHTMFGRWLLPAYVQEVTRVATDLRDGRATASTHAPVRKPAAVAAAPRAEGAGVPTVVLPPRDSYRPREQVVVEVAGDDPRGPVRPAYSDVQRADGDRWRTVDDGSGWATTVRWRRSDAGWTTTLTWDVPDGTTGRHRLRLCTATGSWVDAPAFDVAPAGGVRP